ncbi:uncharacterized protein PFL1_03720 [Pseudozyma flocculosa PF-1]|uniref:Large ribosomal subunit protein bL28m n=2 Tax=Pseudozyma flocculosa TaxID=84751 RepID=A0A5C3F5W0_9BASI|nr:uncharacterized protein PFL1_03720 [Pseudozyma flocculosa PF-1]EPQ28920.1 hypothetical protein PFL1_03720 [Pseudozyma flocculosa PF-1]SPO38591.1 related to MRPL24 - mitochondrial ribosomal protein, large subunit [Pseudozyma flocculosa]
MFASLVRFGSRTTYRGSRGSGAGSSSRTSAYSSPNSRPTFAKASQMGQTFKRSQRGLYDGKTLQSGHNVPKSRQKTARTWAPNVQSKKLWSDVLDTHVTARVTTSALRTIDKMGGLDYYLANTKDNKLGQWGIGLRDVLALRLRQLRLEGKKVGRNAPEPTTSA